MLSSSPETIPAGGKYLNAILSTKKSIAALRFVAKMLAKSMEYLIKFIDKYIRGIDVLMVKNIMSKSCLNS